MSLNIAHDFQSDLDAIAAIPAIPLILDVICRTTGMRFAAVARVTETRWVAMAVQDSIAFGLAPGGELKVETTLCTDVCASREQVVIDHVAQDPVYRDHHTPARYGFQSYISVPILLADGSFFGTLCAIDPNPSALNNPAVTGMFKQFAALIAATLDEHRRLLTIESETMRLREQFRAGLGHDMRNTLAAMDAGTRLLLKTPLNARATLIVNEMQASALKLSHQIAQAMAETPADGAARN